MTLQELCVLEAELEGEGHPTLLVGGRGAAYVVEPDVAREDWAAFLAEGEVSEGEVERAFQEAGL